jgi:cytidylate kinase
MGKIMGIRKKQKGYLVAIDGPAGAGKSTVSQHLAKALKGQLLDTGAMYRSVAFFGLEKNAQTEKEFIAVARKTKFSIHKKKQILLSNGKNLGKKIRTPRVSEWASLISKYKEVRKILTKKQRELGEAWSKNLPVVVEGRDIGSVVFPDVQFKFFLTAAAAIRAQRRYEQLVEVGTSNITLEDILIQNKKRDNRDSTRKFAPLKCPKDAIVIDTSSMKISQVVQFMKNHIGQQLLMR